MNDKGKAAAPLIATPAADIKIDVTKIPAHVRDDLAATILDCVREYIQQPGAQERHGRWLQARKGKGMGSA